MFHGGNASAGSTCLPLYLTAFCSAAPVIDTILQVKTGFGPLKHSVMHIQPPKLSTFADIISSAPFFDSLHGNNIQQHEHCLRLGIHEPCYDSARSRNLKVTSVSCTTYFVKFLTLVPVTRIQMLFENLSVPGCSGSGNEAIVYE